VLLLEADLRRPTLAQQLDLKPGPGVSDVLLGAVSLSEATQVIHLHHSPPDDPGERLLDVAVAGAEPPSNPGELIESEAMQDLLEHASSSYDLVVIDTPPLIPVSDAFPLLGEVDGVIVVGRVGRSRRDVLERLHEILIDAGAPLLGVIANGVKVRRRSSDGYAPAEPRHLAAAAPSANGSSPNGASAPEELVSAPPERPLAVLYGEAIGLPPAVADPPAEDAD
jgi:Mrp family chromosome partitioning ATPase